MATGLDRISASRLTKGVDTDGQAIVFCGDSSDGKLWSVYSELVNKANLLLTIVPKQLVDFDQRIEHIMKFFISFGSIHVSLQRIIIDFLFIDAAQLNYHNLDIELGFNGSISAGCNDFPFAIPYLPFSDMNKLPLFLSQSPLFQIVLLRMKNLFRMSRQKKMAIFSVNIYRALLILVPSTLFL
jgi:hypothetical protein